MVGDFKNTTGLWVRSYVDEAGKPQHTKSDIVWKSMRNRCVKDGQYQISNKNAVGCYLSQDFESFQKFTDWHVDQVGYSEVDYHLDKDLLFEGNKEYSKETCVLLPSALNSFFATSKATRGQYPQGVCFVEKYNKFKAQVSIRGKVNNLGHFNSVEEAQAAYARAKTEVARDWYKRISNGEFVVDNRVTERLSSWEFREVD